MQWARDNTPAGSIGCGGFETYDLQTGTFIGHVYDGHQHSDLGVLPDGNTEFVMPFEQYHPSGRGSVAYRVLPGPAVGLSEPNYSLVFDWNSGGGHISCQGPNGTALVSFGAVNTADGMTPFEGEIVLFRTDRTVRRLAHHRSSECGYWVQPRASISGDGRYIVFASDWGRKLDCPPTDLGRGDPYIIDLGAAQ
jgi:hypothetical protein